VFVNQRMNKNDDGRDEGKEINPGGSPREKISPDFNADQPTAL
jgi:hypothetical protein